MYNDAATQNVTSRCVNIEKIMATPMGLPNNFIENYSLEVVLRHNADAVSTAVGIVYILA